MLPGNVDPRRPDKVQRYKAPPANANGQGEDLTPDYMNILGQRATTVSNAEAEKQPPTHPAAVDSGVVPSVNVAPSIEPAEEAPPNPPEDTNSNSSGATANVIPTSPQYGVAILPNSAAPAPPPQVDLPTETVTISTDSVVDTTAKPPDDPNKELHSTPSRNDRFKVVKIASLEPFKRGRWKCMDYVDEAPPMTLQTSKATQSAGSVNVPASAAAGGGGGAATTTVYLQTQSLPQQQIQQMLMQGGFTNGQFFPSVHQQMVPQAQYFYQQGNVQTQTLPQQLVGATAGTSMPAQFINAGAQPYFTGAVVQNSAGFAIPANYQNVQYVPANMLQNQQGSAFVPTSQQAVQMPANFQQSQTYAGQPTQPMVNGHAYPTPNEQVTTSLPTQTAKSVILNTTAQPVVTQAQISQPNIQNQIPVVNSQSQSVPIIQQNQQQQPYQNNFQQVVPPNAQVFDQNQKLFEQNQQQTVPVPSSVDKQANNVYTNPQFDMNVNSLTVLEGAENSENVAENPEATSENPDDPSKTNPVVNAIDNKIEQAMDLVKSHLMYTVREEVEVLKEKIAELMERIQQLETENNFLRSQIPKSQTPGGAATPVLTATTTSTTTTTTTNESTQ